MKRIALPLIIAFSFFSTKSNAQVGINTSTPASTLDITAKNATGSTSNVDGVLVPRVDRLRAQNMASVPTSTLIYINNVATGLQSGQTANVDAVGYYYFDGSAWVKLYNPSNSTFSSVNIYNTDGSLTGNRIVTQAANTLAFTGTAANAFSVDGTTLSVDAASDRVGLGTITPNEKLDVRGAVSFTGKAVADKTAFDNLNEFASNTFTAAATGLYKVDFVGNFPQRASTEDNGDGYLSLLTFSLNGVAYGFASNMKVPLPEISGGPSSISNTHSTVVKMNAGDTLTFAGLTFGSTPNTTTITASFALNIVRID